MKTEKPRRVSHTYEQMIEAPPERIFPLYCPVREVDWVAGWDPSTVYSSSGVVEEDCVFVTRTREGEAVWVVTAYDAEAHHLEVLKVTPEVTVCRIVIDLEEIEPGRTKAVITYTKISLGQRGDRILERFTAQFYESFMVRWETAMNHYLKTGERLEA